MNKWKQILSLLLVSGMLLTAGCGTGGTASETDLSSASGGAASSAQEEQSGQVAAPEQMTTVEDVVEDGMVPVYGSSVRDGVYPVTVDSSSSMFQITACELTVKGGQMTAVMHMGGTGYLKVFMGTGEEAVKADEDSYIPYEEGEDGTHTFTVPVEALDMGISCAAFSKSKELWYDRTLVFRMDSLPMDAFQDGVFATAESLGLEDGSYTVEVQLEGGSGRASVESPAAVRVENGAAYATVVWGSSNYDYMRVGEEKLLPVNTEGNSAFEIPVAAFDWKLTVYGDTTAMSTPHEIAYSLYFDSATLEKVG